MASWARCVCISFSAFLVAVCIIYAPVLSGDNVTGASVFVSTMRSEGGGKEAAAASASRAEGKVPLLVTSTEAPAVAPQSSTTEVSDMVYEPPPREVPPNYTEFGPG